MLGHAGVDLLVELLEGGQESVHVLRAVDGAKPGILLRDLPSAAIADIGYLLDLGLFPWQSLCGEVSGGFVSPVHSHPTLTSNWPIKSLYEASCAGWNEYRD